jgi:hypothetical protein
LKYPANGSPSSSDKTTKTAATTFKIRIDKGIVSIYGGKAVVGNGNIGNVTVRNGNVIGFDSVGSDRRGGAQEGSCHKEQNGKLHVHGFNHYIALT